MKHAILLLTILIACDPVNDTDLREGSTGAVCEPDLPPPAPPLDGCLCDPELPICKAGLGCVPTGNGKEHACLPRCGGWTITACEAEGQPIDCFYPFHDPDLGTGDAYCPVCLGCAPPPAGTLICQ